MEQSKYEAKTHTSYNNSLIESRFKVLLFLYRIGGIPFKVKSASRLNAVFNASLIVCFYITYICVCVCVCVCVCAHVSSQTSAVYL